ncbi:ABC transporter ATP-binding protein [Microbacterium sp. NPDC090003]|uniref:ABC transporter ATP-binding protein n=1 Tax=Microbacterium sp. NPDC090003 TaxID=3364203 RepID=UPI00381CAD66
MTASPDARPEKAEDPTTESKATPEKRTATSKRASASSAAAKKGSPARTSAAKKTPAVRTPAKRPSTAKAAAEKAAAGTDIVIEPVSAAGSTEKKVPARPASGARATTRTPAKTATAAKTTATKSAATKKTAAASTTGAAKTTAAKTTAAKTAAAKSTAAKSTAAKSAAAKTAAAKTAAAKTAAAKTAAAKTAATKAQAAKSTARTAASRAASSRTTAAKTAAEKAAAAQVAEVAEPKPQAPVTIESTRIHPPAAPAEAVEVAETADAAEIAGVEEMVVEADSGEPEAVEPEVVEAELVEAELVEAEATTVEVEPDHATVESDASVAAAEPDAPAASGVEALRIRGLVKHFGDNRAVHGIDLSVPAGSFYGIVGPNGAGKTTTLSIIAGLLRADAGSVVICGIDQATNSQAAKRVMGVLPDRLRTFDRLTGRQLLYYYGLLRGLASDVIEKRVADLARAFDLGDALGRVVSDYSAGMTKKVMLAGAMIHSPRVLVLDEPFESVDPVSSAVILDILRAYVAHGGTVILSSHGMDLVERVCSRVAIIVDGEVLAEGTIDEVRAGQTLEARFVELSGGIGEVEGLEWLHTFSD